MTSKRTICWPLVSILLCALIAFATSTGAESHESGEKVTEPWDQAKVTGLAKGLAKSVDDVQQAFRRELADMMPSGDRRSRYETKQNLRRLRTEARHLASELEKGVGHDETLDVFLNLQELAHDTAESARRTMLTQPTLEQIAAARKILIELAPYYGESWTPVLQPREEENAN